MSARPFGIVAVFDAPERMLAAGRRLHEMGFRAVEAYTPYPVAGLEEIAGLRRRLGLPLIVAAGAAFGAGYGYFVQYWGEALGYPLNVGGRPFNSWPAFIVGAFELMLLMAVAAGFFGLWASCRLPRLHHPIFAAAAFERASCDRFVLCVEAHDPSYRPGPVRRLLERHGAVDIVEVTAVRAAA